MKRDLISEQDLTIHEIQQILDMTKALKKDTKKIRKELEGRTIGLIFQKPSNRTRVSFEVGVYQLGGQCLYLGPGEINLGVRESTHDVAKTLSRYLDGIVARTFLHQDVVDLAQHASVPVINGLSDLYHPCQALADIFSIQERFRNLKGLTLAYIGDGNNNVCHSLLLACSKVGINVNVASPEGYEPKAEVLKIVETNLTKSRSQTEMDIGQSPADAVKGAHIIYGDVWVSMGQEKESQKRLKDLADYQINKDLLKRADKDYIFMHCLPAHRGEEVTADIIDGEHSIVFDQAENRLHVQKAILIFLLMNS